MAVNRQIESVGAGTTNSCIEPRATAPHVAELNLRKADSSTRWASLGLVAAHRRLCLALHRVVERHCVGVRKQETHASPVAKGADRLDAFPRGVGLRQ